MTADTSYNQSRDLLSTLAKAADVVVGAAGEDFRRRALVRGWVRTADCRTAHLLLSQDGQDELAGHLLTLVPDTLRQTETVWGLAATYVDTADLDAATFTVGGQ